MIMLIVAIPLSQAEIVVVNELSGGMPAERKKV